MLRPVTTVNVPALKLKALVERATKNFDAAHELYDKYGIAIFEEHEPNQLNAKMGLVDIFDTVFSEYSALGQFAELTIGVYELASLVQAANFEYLTEEEILDSQVPLTPEEEGVEEFIEELNAEFDDEEEEELEEEEYVEDSEEE